MDKYVYEENVEKKKRDYKEIDIDYDLKDEIRYYPQVNECLNKIREYTKCGNTYIEKYLLFKLQRDLNYSFDCDKTIPVKKTFGKNLKYDTMFSLQWIWGELLTKFYKTNNEQRYQINDKEYKFLVSVKNPKIQEEIKDTKFLYELEHLGEIKNILGDDLFNKINDFAHYYHTIGNMAPCPSFKEKNGKSFNQNKGSLKYDRLDRYLLIADDETKEWFNNNKSKYYLEDFIYDIGDVPIPKDIKNKEEVNKLIDYFDKLISIIKNRTKKLLEEMNSNGR